MHFSTCSKLQQHPKGDKIDQRKKILKSSTVASDSRRFWIPCPYQETIQIHNSYLAGVLRFFTGTSIKNGRKTLQKHATPTTFAAAQKNIVSCIMAQRGARFQLRANYFPTSAGFSMSRTDGPSGFWMEEGFRGPRAVIRPRRNTRLGTDFSPTATHKLATVAILKYGLLRAV